MPNKRTTESDSLYQDIEKMSTTEIVGITSSLATLAILLQTLLK